MLLLILIMFSCIFFKEILVQQKFLYLMCFYHLSHWGTLFVTVRMIYLDLKAGNTDPGVSRCNEFINAV